MGTNRRIKELENKTDYMKPPDPLEQLLDLAATVYNYSERNILARIEPLELRRRLSIWRESETNKAVYNHDRPPTEDEIAMFYNALERSRMWLVAALTLAGPEWLKPQDKAAAMDRIRELSPAFQEDPCRGPDLEEQVKKWHREFDADLLEKFIPDAKGILYGRNN